MTKTTRKSLVLFTTLLVICAGTAAQATNLDYDMSRGERIATAYSHYIMERPDDSRPEVLSLLSQTTTQRGLEADLKELAERLAVDLKAQTKYKQSIEVFESLIATERKMGARDISLVDSYNDLASVYVAAKDFSSAEQMLQLAFAITEKFHGADSYESAQCLDKLANLQSLLKHYQKELQLRQQALAIREVIYIDSRDFLIQPYADLGNLALNMGEKDKALSLYLSALEIADRNHPAHSEAMVLREKIRAIRKETK